MYKPLLKEKGYEIADATLERIVGMVKTRISFVADLWEETNFFFEAPTEYDEKSIKKRWKEESPALMAELGKILEGISDFTSANMEKIVMDWIEKNGHNTGTVMNSFRITIIGAARGPHMFDIIEILGKEETLRRLNAALAVIK